MARSCQTFSHTADVGLEAKAGSRAELFEAMAEGLANYVCPREKVQPQERKTICVKAEDAEALLVDFLSDILAAIQVQRFAISSVKVSQISQNNNSFYRREHREQQEINKNFFSASSAVKSFLLEAEISGQPFDPSRHEILHEVKAVTYHQLCVEFKDGKWSGRVILDI